METFIFLLVLNSFSDLFIYLFILHVMRLNRDVGIREGLDVQRLSTLVRYQSHDVSKVQTMKTVADDNNGDTDSHFVCLF